MSQDNNFLNRPENARARARGPLFKHNSIFPRAPTEQMRKETRAPLAAAAAVMQ